MSSNVLELRVGARVWFDGGAWTVCEVLGAEVRLRDSGNGYRLTAIDELLGRASELDTDLDEVGPHVGMTSVALSRLTAKQRSMVERRLAVLAPLLEANPVDSDALSAAAASLGISTRTVRRRLDDLRNFGPAGLIDERLLKDTRRSVDPRWDDACNQILREHVDRSTPSRATVIRQANAAFLAAVPGGQVPSKTVAYARVGELDRGRYTFGEAKQRRSVAKRPQGVLGQLRPTRPGEYVLMDGYMLDVFAMEPVTMRWVNTELTVAMDLYDRSLKGIRLRPVAAKSADVAGVLLQCLTPQQWGRASSAPSGPYAGVPENVILGSVGVLPDTIVIDHGKVYMSEHTLGVCRRLGISMQPAIPNNPTDKAALERFFRSLRLSLLDKLPGYKGQNIASRGKDVELGAFYYVTELEQLIREWVGEVYHVKAHKGLRDPRLPGVDLSPQEMFNRGIAVSGLLRLPGTEGLRYELMEVQWRQIHHYGVDIDNRRYDGSALNPYRDRRSDFGGAHAGKWPFMVDVDDVRTVYFQDPGDNAWHRLKWRLADGIDAPFSADAADYTRWLSVQEQRHTPRTRYVTCGQDLREAPVGRADERSSRLQEWIVDLALRAHTDPEETTEVCGLRTSARDLFDAVLELVTEQAGGTKYLNLPDRAPQDLLRRLAAAREVLTQPDARAATELAARHQLLNPGGTVTPIAPDHILTRRPRNPLLTAIRFASLGNHLPASSQLVFRIGSGRPRYPSQSRPDQGLPAVDATQLAWIPQQIWPGLLDPWVDDNDHRDRAASSMLLAKVGSTRPWRLIAVDLGLPAAFAPHPASLIRHLKRIDAWPAVLRRLDEVATALEAAPPPIDYQARRWHAADHTLLVAAVNHARSNLGPVHGWVSTHLLSELFWAVYTGGDLRLTAPTEGTLLNPDLYHDDEGIHVGKLTDPALLRFLNAAADCLAHATGHGHDEPLTWEPP